MHLPCDEVMQFLHQNSPFLGFSYEQDEPFCDNTEMMPMVWSEGDLHALDPEMLAFPLVDPNQIIVSEPPYFMTEKWPHEVEEKLSGNQVTMNSSSTSASSSSSSSSSTSSCSSSSSSSCSASSVLQGYCMESEGHIHCQYSSSFPEIIMLNPPSHDHTSLVYAKEGNYLPQYTNPIHTSDDEKRKRDASESEDSYEDVVSRKPRQGRSTKRARAAETHNQSERNRRGRINEKLRALQELIPNANKTDKASLLTEVISYLKMLRLQLQVMSYRNAMRNTCSPRAAHQLHIPPLTPAMTSDRTNFQPTMQVGCIANAPTHFSNGPAPKPFAFDDEDPFSTIQHPALENPTIFPSSIVHK